MMSRCRRRWRPAAKETVGEPGDEEVRACMGSQATTSSSAVAGGRRVGARAGRIGALIGALAMCGHLASSSPSAHASFPAHEMSLEHTLLAFDFDGAPFQNQGIAAVATEVRGNQDALSIATGAPGSGNALRFPAFSPQGGETPVAIAVRAEAAGGLDVGSGRFGIGVDISLDPQSAGSISDNGNNVVQRGLFDGPAQFKIEVDDGTVACRISGSSGVVYVRDSVRIEPQTWYRVGCVRDGDQVTLTVAEFDTPSSSHRRIVGAGPTGDLRFSKAPLSIGGKVNANGDVLTGDADQFNGSIDNVVFGTGGPTTDPPPTTVPPPVEPPITVISDVASGPYAPAVRLRER